MFGKATILSALVSAVSAGTIIWDGRFNEMSSSADLEKWSWANQVSNHAREIIPNTLILTGRQLPILHPRFWSGQQVRQPRNFFQESCRHWVEAGC